MTIAPNATGQGRAADFGDAPHLRILVVQAVKVVQTS
jgi:hypothetical protein